MVSNNDKLLQEKKNDDKVTGFNAHSCQGEEHKAGRQEEKEAAAEAVRYVAVQFSPQTDWVVGRGGGET